MSKTVMMLWAPFGDRARELSEAVGAEEISITFLYGPRYFAPIRYVVLSIRTILLLFRRSPDVVIAQNPPIFCPLVCLLYCSLSGARLIIDHHSIWKVKTLGKSPLSRAIGFLEGVVSRAAWANTTVHGVWGRMLVDIGASRVEVIHDFVAKNPSSRNEELRRRFSDRPTICIASHGGHPLERLELEAEAVAQRHDLSLLICGPTAKLAPRIAGLKLPPNVKYVGFLDKSTYETLKASVDFALNITDEPYTLSHVIFEFAASGIPVVSSKEEVVKELFGNSLLYADSKVERVRERVDEMSSKSEREVYAARIRHKQEELSELHDEELHRLKALLS